MKLSLKVSDETQEKLNVFIAKNQFLFLAIIIIFVGALWRLWGLNIINRLSPQEFDYLSTTNRLIHAGWRLPLAELYRAVGLYFYAGLGYITRFNILYLRVGQALIASLSVLVFFLFVKSWFNKQVALIATLFYATNAAILIYSRVVLDSMLVITLQLLILYIITIAFRDKNIWLFILSSFLAVLGIFLSPIFLISGILIFGACVAVALKNIKFVTAYKYQLLVLILPILIAIGAYIFFFRYFAGSVITYINPGSFADFYLNIGKNVITLISGSVYRDTYSVGSEPLLDPFIAVSFLCGIVYAFFHAGKRKHQFLLLWLLFGLVTISLSSRTDIGYLLLILPIIFIFSAMVLDYLLTNWARTFPFNKFAQILMTLFFSIFLFLSIYYNFQKFFYAWQGNAKVQADFTKTIDYKR